MKLHKKIFVLSCLMWTVGIIGSARQPLHIVSSSSDLNKRQERIDDMLEAAVVQGNKDTAKNLVLGMSKCICMQNQAQRLDCMEALVTLESAKNQERLNYRNGLICFGMTLLAVDMLKECMKKQ
jgi:hypothetical protein